MLYKLHAKCPNIISHFKIDFNQKKRQFREVSTKYHGVLLLVEKAPGPLPRFPRNAMSGDSRNFAKPMVGVFSNLEIMCGRKMPADWLDTAGAELGALRTERRIKPMHFFDAQILLFPLRAQLHGKFKRRFILSNKAQNWCQ